jgi:salicylate synthetase
MTSDPSVTQIAEGVRAPSIFRALRKFLRPIRSFSYSGNDETRMAFGRSIEILVDKGIILVVDASGVRHREIATKPLQQVGRLLSEFGSGHWTAYGFLGFDLAAYYHDYHRNSQTPALHLVIPETECRIANGRLRVTGNLASESCQSVTRLDVNGTPIPTRVAPSDLGERDRYVEKVQAAVAAIRRGEIEKVILSRRISVPGTLDLDATYDLAENNIAERHFCFALGDVVGVGCPPGLLLRAHPNGEVDTTPLAGTQPRGASPEADSELARTLLSDAKEVREHLIAVRLATSEMNSVCEPGSTRVEDFMAVKKYRTVQHLTSRVAGRLASGCNVWDAISALFPSVTVTGVEKSPAIRLIDGLEDCPRGAYAGAVGWVDHQGAADLGIAIRSVFQTGDHVMLSAGAGIVAESSPEGEYLESENKMNTMRTRMVLVERR